MIPAIGEPIVADTPFERFWRRCLHRGIIAGTTAEPVDATPAGDAAMRIGPAQTRPSGIEVMFRPDPSIWDGRWANNAWLQELPKPITNLTWDNAVLMAPSLAERLGVTTEQVVELTSGGRRVSGPVFIVPGHAADAVTVHLGYGRTAAGVGEGAGFDASRIRTSEAPWNGGPIEITATRMRYPLASSQEHHLMQGRDFVRAGTFDLFQRLPDYPRHRHHEPPADTLYPEWPEEGEQWGMSIDTTVCTGCNACVVACQAENNIPAVGKQGVLAGREMHWLRIDHYFQGSVDNPRSFFQPMLCQHCEKAPCEVVCPVAATTHSADGLNQMIYNRCVGTRYCSNNCPYKVRRFNFFDHRPAPGQPTLRMLMNPDVTVRTLGVMEKCTYCVQRINGARIDAKRDGRALQDGDVVTACQAACPTQAIVFGDISDPGSRVAALKRQPHDFALLGELNVRPRTTYLAALRHLNPALEDPLGAPEEQQAVQGDRRSE
jgi:molybdopterin-containing oxidoreductase family iron-sulfur binding subunit